jgi:phosphoribosyl-AMP cyclohydrolase
VRVGGGIRDIETARSWLDAGAAKVIIGTAATPELLAALPADRVIVALDNRDGKVLTHGWRRETEGSLAEHIAALRGMCAGFLITFVELEGRMSGTDLVRAADLVAAAGNARVTVAGGVTSTTEIAYLDALGADAQVGMALYSGQLSLGDAIAAPLSSDRDDGLWPTVVVDQRGRALGLAWSSAGSLRQAVETRRGVYQSRSRGLWKKGASSGATQELLRVDLDCDRDVLRFTVHQHGSGFCHTGTRSCWGEDSGLDRLSRRIERMALGNAAGGSNTRKLLEDQADRGGQ